MTKEQYAEMLHDISETHKTGGDTAACIAKYRKRYKFAYIYNDTIFKLLFGTPENMEFTASFPYSSWTEATALTNSPS